MFCVGVRLFYWLWQENFRGRTGYRGNRRNKHRNYNFSDYNSNHNCSYNRNNYCKDKCYKSSPNTTAKSTGGSTGKVNSAVIAEASSGKKQPVSKATLNATKPKETTTPTGARVVATSAAVCDIMDRLGIGLVGVPQTSVTAIASRYNGVKTVGSPMSPDMEIIKSLNPTDVIGPDTLKGDLEISIKILVLILHF